jgi:hypothetical protein
MLYSCPICNVKIESLGSAMLWCRCLPETPTQMDDVAWSRSISNAVRPMIAGLKGRS